MIELVSVCDLCGKGYSVGPRQRFRVPADVAESLISRGLAYPYREPVERPKYTAVYQTKDVVPDRKGQRK